MKSSHIVMKTVNHDMNCTHVVMKHVSGDMRFCILDMIEMQRRQSVTQFHTKQLGLDSTHLHPPAVVPSKGAEMVDSMGRGQV